MDEKPSRTEDEYFAKQNLEIIRRMREERDAQRQAEAATRAPLACPRCGAALEERRLESVLIDVCPQCSGVWLDSGELEILRHADPRGGRSFLGSLFGPREG